MQKIANIFWLGTKELRSFLHDYVLLALVFYAFSLAVIAQAQSNSQEVHNASVGIVDEDHSDCCAASPARFCRLTSSWRGRSPSTTSFH